MNLVSLDEESIDAKNVYESTTKYNSLSEDINIGFIMIADSLMIS